jgi:predicted GNAT family acetyltransferase
METTISQNEDRSAFEATVDGRRCELHYSRLDGSTVAFDHTYVPPDLRGRGIAAELTVRALAWARAEGLRVVPSCSYVSAFMAQHPEWEDVRASRQGPTP